MNRRDVFRGLGAALLGAVARVYCPAAALSESDFTDALEALPDDIQERLLTGGWEPFRATTTSSDGTVRYWLVHRTDGWVETDAAGYAAELQQS